MKIREIITEKAQGSWKREKKSDKRDPEPWVVGNEHAKIARSAKDAAQMRDEKDKGFIEGDDARKNLERVRDMYGMQLVDDFLDVLELPNGIEGTDDQMSMFSKDLRK
jgi:hypothetical protein